MYKKVFIFGPDHNDAYKSCKSIYGDTEDVLIIGDGQRNIDLLEIKEFKGQIASDAYFFTLFHGGITCETHPLHGDSEARHVTMVKSHEEDRSRDVLTADLFDVITDIVGVDGSPIVDIRQCYGGGSFKDSHFLPENARLIAFAPENRPSTFFPKASDFFDQNKDLEGGELVYNLFMQHPYLFRTTFKNTESDGTYSTFSAPKYDRFPQDSDIEDLLRNFRISLGLPDKPITSDEIGEYGVNYLIGAYRFYSDIPPSFTAHIEDALGCINRRSVLHGEYFINTVLDTADAADLIKTILGKGIKIILNNIKIEILLNNKKDEILKTFFDYGVVDKYKALDAAVEFQNVELVSYFLSKGAHPNNINIETLLRNKKDEILKTFFDYGVVDKYKALDAAVGFQNVELISYFLSKGVDPNAVQQILAYAISGYNKSKAYEITKLLYEYGIDINQDSASVTVNYDQNFRGLTLQREPRSTAIIKCNFLTFALYSKKPEILKFLLSKGLNPNSIDNVFANPIMFAVHQKNHEIFRLFKDHIAGLGLKCKKEILVFSMNAKSIDIYKDLINSGFKVGQKEVQEFFDIVELGEIENSKALLEAGFDPSVKIDGSNLSITGHAKKVGASIEMKTLLKKYKKIHRETTQLGEAIKRSYYELADDLISDGANVNEVDDSGRTPLIYAIDNQNLLMTKLLIAEGADIGFNFYGWSLLKIAINKNDYDIAKYLIEQGITITSGDYSILFELIESKDLGKVQKLLEIGFDFSIRKEGKTPLEFAIDVGAPEEMISFIEGHSEENEFFEIAEEELGGSGITAINSNLEVDTSSATASSQSVLASSASLFALGNTVSGPRTAATLSSLLTVIKAAAATFSKGPGFVERLSSVYEYFSQYFDDKAKIGEEDEKFFAPSSTLLQEALYEKMDAEGLRRLETANTTDFVTKQIEGGASFLLFIAATISFYKNQSKEHKENEELFTELFESIDLEDFLANSIHDDDGLLAEALYDLRQLEEQKESLTTNSEILKIEKSIRRQENTKNNIFQNVRKEAKEYFISGIACAKEGLIEFGKEFDSIENIESKVATNLFLNILQEKSILKGKEVKGSRVILKGNLEEAVSVERFMKTFEYNEALDEIFEENEKIKKVAEGLSKERQECDYKGYYTYPQIINTLLRCEIFTRDSLISEVKDILGNMPSKINPEKLRKDLDIEEKKQEIVHILKDMKTAIILIAYENQIDIVNLQENLEVETAEDSKNHAGEFRSESFKAKTLRREEDLIRGKEMKTLYQNLKIPSKSIIAGEFHPIKSSSLEI